MNIFESIKDISDINEIKHFLKLYDIDIQNNDKYTLLNLSSENGYTNIVNYLLENKANPNILNNYKWSPLMSASFKGYKEIVEKLLRYDAYINDEDDYARTALSLASSKGHKEIVEILLNQGARIITAKGESTPLHLATSGGHIECVKILLKYYENINIRNTQGYTSLDLSRNNEISKLISEHKVDNNFTKCYRSKASNVHFTEMNRKDMLKRNS